MKKILSAIGNFFLTIFVVVMLLFTTICIVIASPFRWLQYRKSHFFQDTGFTVVFTACTADPHTDFSRCIAAEHGTLLHQNDLCSVTRRRNRSTHTCKTAADHAQISGIL